MLGCRATSLGKTRRSIPAYGRRRLKARAWYAVSTSTATDKETWRAMAASIGPSWSIRSTPIAIGRANSAETTSPMASSARISLSTACQTQEVCIGDRYRIGGALFEVTQPRVTCYRVGIRMNEPQMAALLVTHGRPGFYFRVLEEGEVEAGDEITQVASGPRTHERRRDRCAALHARSPRDQLERALRIPALSAGWRGSFEALLEAGAQRRRDDRKCRAHHGVRPAAGVARVPPAAGIAQGAREQQRDLAGARARGRAPSGRSSARPVRRGAAKAGPDAPALMRSYSLSGEPSAARYRVSVKREAHGAAGAYIDDDCRSATCVDASAPRGSFTLTAGRHACCLAECRHRRDPGARDAHALAAEASPREVRWLYGPVTATNILLPRRRAASSKPSPWPQPHPLQLARSRG